MNTFLALIFIGIVLLVILAYNVISVGYSFDSNIGQWFELSDKASTIDKKLEYLDKFDVAVQKYGLTEGQSTVFFPTKETSLEENYIVLKTLLQRLNETSNLSTSSQEYQWAIKQITENEYCWFHVALFKQAFYLKNGGFLLALLPSHNENRCVHDHS
jgi:hypothetical protein